MRRFWCVLALVWSAGLVVQAGRQVRVVAQRGSSDCAVAALAMLTDQDYEEIDATRRVLKISVSNGLYPRDMTQIAARYGVTLRFVAKPRSTDTGIVVIGVEDDEKHGHALVLDHGYIYDPSALTTEPFALAQRHWALGVLYFLRRER